MKALDYTKKLITLSSVSGNEGAIADYIYSVIAPYGTVHRKGNSLALHIIGANTKKAFILNGHLDTVAPSDMWTHDPFEPYEENGKLYGLGASDMKSGVGIMLAIAEQYSKTQPPCDMWYMFVEKEEIDGSGTKELLNHMPDLNAQYPDGVEGIILEPTDAKNIGIGHKGNVFVELEFSGDGGHGSVAKPYAQRAIHKAAVFINDLQNISDRWHEKYSNAVLGEPTINVTNLQSSGSTALNAVPESATVTIDIRTTPELGKNLSQELHAITNKYQCTFSYPHAPNGHGLCPETSTLLKIARNEFKAQDITVFQGATDQLFFTDKNIPVIIYGPGANSAMHQPNEYVEKAAIETCINTIQTIYTHYVSHS